MRLGASQTLPCVQSREKKDEHTGMATMTQESVGVGWDTALQTGTAIIRRQIHVTIHISM
jgi:hypothetical protein